jgi:hypothetical protein
MFNMKLNYLVYFIPVLVLAACNNTNGGDSSSVSTTQTVSSSSLTASLGPLVSISFQGADDTSVLYDSPFNVRTNVQAVGNNGADLSQFITFNTTSTAINRTTGDMDTKQLGLHAVRYTINYEGILAQKWRNITIPLPELPRVGMVLNGNFSYGLIGWNNPDINFIGSGQMTISEDEGAFKAVVKAGNDPWTPRFGQMGVPFIKDETYLVSFKAKASVSKNIEVMLGELLPSDPFFTDFKPRQIQHFNLSSSWETYNFTFTMRLDNPRGGILFHLGKVAGVAVDSTLWFDDIFIEKTTPVADTVGPEITGVETTIYHPINATFYPLLGLAAYDIYEAKDYTTNIIVNYETLSGNPVVSPDLTLIGTYRVRYSVSDLSNNVSQAISTLEIVDPTIIGTNLVTNPNFSNPIVEDQWRLVVPGVFGGVATGNHNLESGQFEISVTEGGSVPYSIQFNQTGVFSLAQGSTYLFSFTARSSVARDISLAFGIPEPWVQYYRKNAVTLSPQMQTYQIIFTVTQATELMKLTFELGNQANFAASTIVFDNVNLYPISLSS